MKKSQDQNSTNDILTMMAKVLGIPVVPEGHFLEKFKVKIGNHVYDTYLSQKEVDHWVKVEEFTKKELKDPGYLLDRISVWEECFSWKKLFIIQLQENGFTTIDGRFWERTKDRRLKTYFIKGGGWVEILDREPNLKDGWSRETVRFKEALTSFD